MGMSFSKADKIWWLFLCLLNVIGIIISNSPVMRVVFGCTIALILCRTFIRNLKWRYALMGLFTAIAIGALIYALINGR